jgi:pilus assembly protein FimV
MAAAASTTDDELGSFSLDDLMLEDEPAQPAAAPGDLDDAFDLSLDELESDLDRDLQAGGDNASLSDLDSLSLDDLSLDADLELEKPVEPVVSKDDELDFDLSLGEAAADSLTLSDDLADFSLDLDNQGAPAASEEDEFLLSLDEEPSAAPAGDELAGLSLELPGDDADGTFDLPADFDLSLGDELPGDSGSDSFATQLEEVTAELDQLANSLEQPVAADGPSEPALVNAPRTAGMDLDGDDDFDFLSGTDETATKLDLARAYIDMGDTEGARDILDEVIAEGNDDQQQEARELITKLV